MQESWVWYEHAQETASYQMICRSSIATRPCYVSEILLLCSHYVYLADSSMRKDDTAAASKQPCMDHEA